jgi:multicomponent Na+:H+ antiporter subunit B
MNSIILRATARILFPVFLMFALFLLLEGHDEPGGGFIAGMVASSSVVLYALAYDAAAARKVIRVEPRVLVAAGLLTSLSSGLLPLAVGREFLCGVWTTVRIPGGTELALGTPLLFDAGVFLLVVGVVLMILLEMMEA